ncbi:MAG TPA: prephenate dehydrogenase/arogenate dehydrogenase family protein, partial [Gaiellales bacterium]|nr:prephenate dehydrogenase/arogenate dehydrogenase family protein [Gaiellales bacterium]
MIQRLAIVGLGLMGGSLGLAARERAGVGRVVGFDPDPGALEAALTRGCVDEVAGDLAAAVAGAELVALCAPVTELPAVLAELAALAPEATITDIGSTKAGVVAAVPPELRPRFIGGHPIAGMETRGAQNARAELFEGATWYLTPLAETEPARLRDLHRLLAALGATPVAIDAGVHDR